MKINIKFNCLNSKVKEMIQNGTEFDILGCVMCKTKRCLILSNLMNSKLEILVIFYLVFQSLIRSIGI